MKISTALGAIGLALTFTGLRPVAAQTVVYETYRPIVAPTYVAAESPVVVESYRPVISSYSYAPPVSSPNFTSYSSNYRGTTSYYAPAPVTAYSPVTSYAPTVTYSPVVTSPVVTTYSPVVTSYAAPVTTYRPVVTSYYTPYVVRTKVFVPGEPVRNFFRAITP